MPRTVKLMPGFKLWLEGMADRTTQVRLARRLEKLANGQLGDVKRLNSRVSELRETFGPGWRMYYTIISEDSVLMLCGGTKASQERDIARANRLANAINE